MKLSDIPATLPQTIRDADAMNLEDMYEAYLSDEMLEYHVTGKETGANHLLSVPGWYPCIVNWVLTNGNVEIIVIRPDDRTIDVTVLKCNIPIAFRRKQEQPV